MALNLKYAEAIAGRRSNGGNTINESNRLIQLDQLNKEGKIINSYFRSRMASIREKGIKVGSVVLLINSKIKREVLRVRADGHIIIKGLSGWKNPNCIERVVK